MTVEIYLVTDEDPGPGDGTALSRRLAVAVPDAVTRLCMVGTGDTLAAGFCVAQLARAGDGGHPLVAHCVAPARDGPETWPEGAGPRLCVGRSVVGTLVVGPNTGFAWSFALDELRGLCFLDVEAEERDPWPGALPMALAHARSGHPHAVTGAVPRGDVPALPACVVAHVDVHGTLKTSLASPPAPSGTTLDVRIGDVSAPAIVSDGQLAALDGQLVLAPATSEWPAASGLGPRYLELREGGGSAAARFDAPASGTPIELTPARAG